MGGSGSGRRWHYDARETTEGALPLDIRRLARAGALSPGSVVSWQWTLNDNPYASIRIQGAGGQVQLLYRFRSSGTNWEDVYQPVYIEETACHLGGTRSWWLCPSCGRRVAIIYGPGKYWACRHCYQLAYESQRENAGDRSARKADRIRKKLGWPVGILNGKGQKPKGMHLRTFERLSYRHDVLALNCLASFQQRFPSFKQAVDDWI